MTPNHPRTVFTIGHSKHGQEAFVKLLEENSIEVLVDIRSNPYSRFVPHFNKALLGDALSSSEIKYLFMGDKLGGRPRNKEFYDSEGNVIYSRIAETPEFKEGIERLLKGIKDYRLVLMCGEENPEKCHRHHLVGKSLETRGVTVIHIRGDGRQEKREEIR